MQSDSFLVVAMLHKVGTVTKKVIQPVETTMQ